MSHIKEVAIYAVLMFVAMLSLTLMAPVIQEFIIDRFNASNTEASMFFYLRVPAVSGPCIWIRWCRARYVSSTAALSSCRVPIPFWETIGQNR